MSHYSMFVYFWVKYEWILLGNCLLQIISFWIPPTTQSKTSVRRVICFPLIHMWSNLNENQQIFSPLLHCFLGKKNSISGRSDSIPIFTCALNYQALEIVGIYGNSTYVSVINWSIFLGFGEVACYLQKILILWVHTTKVSKNWKS